MGTLSRQDVQSLLENTKNRIIERVTTRQDVKLLTEATRDRIMNYMHDLLQIHQQNMMRRGDVQSTQLLRRQVALETRIATLEQELKIMRQLIEKLANQTPPQHIYMPIQPENGEKPPYTQYAYKSST